MTEWKGILLSKSFWGVVLLVAARFIPEAAGITSDQIVKVATDVLTALGGVIGIIGILTRKTTIKGLTGSGIEVSK